MSIFSIVNVVIKLTLRFQNNQSNGQLLPIYEVGVKKFVAIKGILEMIWE